MIFNGEPKYETISIRHILKTYEIVCNTITNVAAVRNFEVKSTNLMSTEPANKSALSKTSLHVTIYFTNNVERHRSVT